METRFVATIGDGAKEIYSTFEDLEKEFENLKKVNNEFSELELTLDIDQIFIHLHYPNGTIETVGNSEQKCSCCGQWTHSNDMRCDDEFGGGDVCEDCIPHLSDDGRWIVCDKCGTEIAAISQLDDNE